MYILFTTPTCSYCTPAKEHLDSVGIEYSIVCAKNDLEARKKYKILSAPTLVKLNEDGTYASMIGLDKIKEMA